MRFKRLLDLQPDTARAPFVLIVSALAFIGWLGGTFVATGQGGRPAGAPRSLAARLPCGSAGPTLMCVLARTRYARNGSLHIAYQTVGDGPIDLVLAEQWFSNVDSQWDFPPLARLLEQLASFSHLTVFDKRGTGLSDPVSIDSLPTIEEWIDDLLAVLDAVGSERTVLLSGIGAAYMTLVFAATYPQRTSALVLVDPFARFASADDYPLGRPTELLSQDLERLRASWGVSGGTMNFLAPILLDDRVLAERLMRYERQSASPSAAKAMLQQLYETDVRDVLPAIRVPTLVLSHSSGARVGPAHGRYIADRGRWTASSSAWRPSGDRGAERAADPPRRDPVHRGTRVGSALATRLPAPTRYPSVRAPGGPAQRIPTAS